MSLSPELLADIATYFRARARLESRLYRPTGPLAPRDGKPGGWRETETSTGAQRAAGPTGIALVTQLASEHQAEVASDRTRRAPDEAVRGPLEDVPGFPLGKSERTLDSFHAEIKDCVKCALGHSRTRFVFGVGNPSAALMLVGEAPGREEDLQGVPFVGAAGALLTKILAAIDLSRDDVYIANVLKCRPPGNRDPLPEEIAACRPHLMEQIRIVSPRVLCALGRFAAQLLTGQEAPLSRLRGQVIPFGDAIVIPTYHPSALLRNPSLKRPTWEDMKRVRVELDRLALR